MMRTAYIYKKNIFCGILSEMEDGYHFKYDRDYMDTPGTALLSPIMPLVSGGGTTGFTRESFMDAFVESGIPEIIADKLISKMTTHIDKWLELIEESFLPD